MTERVLYATKKIQDGLWLRQALAPSEVVTLATAEELLLHTYHSVPQIIILTDNFSEEISLVDLITIVRRRSEAMTSRIVAVCSSDKQVRCYQAGADMVLLETLLTPEMLSVAIQSVSSRLQKEDLLQRQASSLQERSDNLVRDERVRDQLVHMLVHDLKNPISAIMGLLELVQEDGEGLIPKDLMNMINLAREEAQHLLYLAANMLDVRKMQAGKMVLTPVGLKPSDLEIVIGQAQADVGIALRERKILVDVRKDFERVVADKEILRRVFANIISNAVKHTRTGGMILVSAVKMGSNIRMAVQDNGEGIPAEDIPNLFAAFEQSRLTMHSRFDTGMGLAFCRLAIEQHGGKIWVESERGKGATFFITIPLEKSQQEDIQVLR